MTLAYGGESKITLMPRIEIAATHNFKFLKLYYGIGCGIYPLMVTGSYSANIHTGFELKFINFESSLSHYRRFKVNIDEENTIPPLLENALHLKMGIRIKGIRLKFVQSYPISVKNPVVDWKFGNSNKYWGIELQILNF